MINYLSCSDKSWTFWTADETIVPVTGSNERPGLAKAKRGRMVRRRSRQGIRVQLGWLASSLGAADIVSEGCVMDDPDGLAYFGSTNIRCLLPRELPVLSTRDRAPVTPAQWVAIVLSDPHARLLLIRVAHRELTSRAGAGTGPMHAEIEGKVERVSGDQVMVFNIDASARVYAKSDPALDTRADVGGQ